MKLTPDEKDYLIKLALREKTLVNIFENLLDEELKIYIETPNNHVLQQGKVRILKDILKLMGKK